MMRRLLLLACVGAGCLSAQLQLNYVNGTYEAPITVAQYSFGTVAVGDSRDVQFSLVNTGTTATPLTMLSVGAPFAVLYGPPLPQTVPAGGAVNFTVSFTPTQAGSFSSTLAADGVSLTVVGTAIASVAISVGCGGNSPVALAAGGSIDFGSLAQGSTTTCQVVMANPTQAALTVQNIAVVNLEGTSFQMQPFSTPFPLAPGGSATLEISFTPSGAGTQQGALEIDQLDIPLTGTGLNPPFPQPIILVTIPDVASSQQGTLAVNFTSPSEASGTGQVQMAFTPATAITNADDGIIFLSNSSQTVPFSVNQGDTAAEFGTASSVTFQTGTTAGTILFTVTLGDLTGTYSLTILAATAGIDATTAQYTSGGLSVQFTAFDNTRTASTMSFTFLDANGDTLNGGPITVDGTAAFQQYFANSDEGGLFALNAFFPVTGGSPQQVASVEIQITNSAGVSPTTQVYFTTP